MCFEVVEISSSYFVPSAVFLTAKHVHNLLGRYYLLAIVGSASLSTGAIMAQAKYYSPRLDRALVTRLYHEAKAQRIPMTVLTNRLVESGLSYQRANTSERSIVAEEPTVCDPARLD